MDIKNTIVEPLLNRGKILSKQEILGVINEYEKRFKNKKWKHFIKYLSRQGYIKRIIFSLYYVNSFDERNRKFLEFEDKEILFMVLNKMGIKWYVGLDSSLYFQGKNWQTPNQISILNTKFRGVKKVLGLRVKFFKIKENFIFGLKKMQTDHKIDFFCSDPAKTYLDKVYFKEADSLIRIKNTNKYLKGYPKWVGKK